MAEQGAYDFNKKEDFDYSHSYDFLGGVGLGRSDLEANRIRLEKLGTFDLEPVDPPPDQTQVNEVVRLATLVCHSKERETLLKRVSDVKDPRMEVIWNNKHSSHRYFEWALHCLDRQVTDWQLIRPGAYIPNRKTVTPNREIVHANVGDKVLVENLKSRPELNGKIGVIAMEEGARWIVEFTDILQTVSLSKSNCSFTRKDQKLSQNELPKGLKVNIVKLSSESGQILNGMEGFVMERKNDRYTVRLDLTGELKSIKEDNLHVVLPTHWIERFDDSSGKNFYVNSITGVTTWDHPILGRKSSEKAEFINPPTETDTKADDSDEFDRAGFLRDEAKRLKLDKSRDSNTVNISKVEEAISELRGILEVSKGSSPMFVGLASELVEILASARPDEKAKWLVLALELLFEDFRKLRFNKKQISTLLDKIETVIAEKSFSNDVIEWILGGLKIAIPSPYTLF